MQLGAEEVWSHSGQQGTVWSVFESFEGIQSVQETIRDVYDDWGSVYLKGVLGSKCRSLRYEANGHMMQYKREAIRFMVGNYVLGI